MRSVAVGRGGRRLATAPGDFFLFSDLHNFRKHPDSAVRAVAKGLLLGFPAGTPGIISHLSVHNIGFVTDGIFLRRHAVILGNLVDFVK